MLRHQLAEIDAAGLGDPDEEQALAAEEERLADLAALRQSAAAAVTALEGSDDSGQGGALGALTAALGALGGRGPLATWTERLRSVPAEVADVASELRHVVESWEDDPERLADVQDRRRLLADLRRKYGPTLADVAAFADDARLRLGRLVEDEDRADVLAARTERRPATTWLGRRPTVLAARGTAAPVLGRAVARRLADLAMTDARFEVEVTDDGAGGAVRFLLGANPGEPLQPLARVASGGELARSMLALRLVAAGGPATMVFDEVDAGVGGAAALALARALREVSADRQVLVVTHLAQVAAFADHQVAVGKVVQRGRTMTRAAGPRRDAERVVEISRMLSGHPDSATARAHAEELLALGRTDPADPARQPAGSATVGRVVD